MKPGNNTSPLLINESPMQCLPSLAHVLGDSSDSAMFLQQIHYWLNYSRTYRNGRYWVYNTIEQWHYAFWWWSESKIKRIVAKLRHYEFQGKVYPLLLTEQFSTNSFNHCLYYSINYDALNELSAVALKEKERVLDSIVKKSKTLSAHRQQMHLVMGGQVSLAPHPVQNEQVVSPMIPRLVQHEPIDGTPENQGLSGSLPDMHPKRTVDSVRLNQSNGVSMNQSMGDNMTQSMYPKMNQSTNIHKTTLQENTTSDSHAIDSPTEAPAMGASQEEAGPSRESVSESERAWVEEFETTMHPFRSRDEKERFLSVLRTFGDAEMAWALQNARRYGGETVKYLQNSIVYHQQDQKQKQAHQPPITGTQEETLHGRDEEHQPAGAAVLTDELMQNDEYWLEQGFTVNPFRNCIR